MLRILTSVSVCVVFLNLKKASALDAFTDNLENLWAEVQKVQSWSRAPLPPPHAQQKQNTLCKADRWKRAELSGSYGSHGLQSGCCPWIRVAKRV